MANPVFARSDTFNGRRAQQNTYQQQFPGQQFPGQQQFQQQAPTGAVMTLDDVIAKTAICLLAVFASAAATFILMPDSFLFPALIGASIIGLITVFVVAARRVLPVGGVLFYALVQGVFVGAISKWFETMWSGIVVSAVLATFIAAGATLAAYKFLNIRVTPKFRKFVFIGTLSLAGVMVVNFVLALFGLDTGLRDIGSGAGWLSIGISVLAVGLAVFNLIVDFDFVERGIASQAPATESWRAAFGITVTMVWLYVEILRILSYFRD